MSLNNSAAALDDLTEEGADELNAFVNEPHLIVLDRRPAEEGQGAQHIEGTTIHVSGSLSISF